MAPSRAVLDRLAAAPLDAFDALRVEPQARPEPGPDEVVIAVRAAHVNRVDLLMMSGQYQHVPEPPYTPGVEFAGEIVAGGERRAVIADGLWTGPRSPGKYRTWGGFASYALAPKDAVIPMPAGYSFDEAACLLANTETAYHALVHRARVRAGETVLVLGATGSTGLSAVQVAKAVGAVVIAVGRSEDKLAVARSLGADHAIPADGLKDAVRGLTGGRGADVVFDAVGGPLSTEGLRAAAYGARFVVVGWASTPFVAREGRDPNLLPTNLILMKSIDVLGSPAAIAIHKDPSLRAERLAWILPRADVLRPHVGRAYPWEGLRDALRAKWDGTCAGSVVVRPEPADQG